jgi:hypothetical protein
MRHFSFDPLNGFLRHDLKTDAIREVKTALKVAKDMKLDIDKGSFFCGNITHTATPGGDDREGLFDAYESYEIKSLGEIDGE